MPVRHPDRLDNALGNARTVDAVLGVLSKDHKVREAIKLSLDEAAVVEQQRINNPRIVGASPGGGEVIPEGEPQPGVFGAALHNSLQQRLSESLAWDG